MHYAIFSNPSVLPLNSTFRQYFIYFVAHRVNLKLFFFILEYELPYFA